jgi:hypothetical protein
VNPGDPARDVIEIPADASDFLGSLVKGSRQKPHHVKWVDRDGTPRVTVLSQADAVRLNAVAGRMRVSREALLRCASHVPVTRPQGPDAAPAAGTGEKRP